MAKRKSYIRDDLGFFWYISGKFYVFVLRLLQLRCAAIQKRADSRLPLLTEFKLARPRSLRYTGNGNGVSCRVYH